MRIEHAAGLENNAVLLMRNPPWALPLAYPLGFIGLKTAAILWSLVLLACLVVSVRLIQMIHNFPWKSHSLARAFVPAGIDLPDHGTNFAFRTAWFGLVSQAPSHPSIRSRRLPLAYVLSNLTCSSHSASHYLAGLSCIGVTGSWQARRRHWPRVAAAAYCIDPSAWPRLPANDARSRSRQSIHTLPQRRPSPLAQATGDVASIPAGLTLLRLGTAIFLASTSDLGLDRKRRYVNAGFPALRTLLLAIRSGSGDTRITASRLPEPVRDPRCAHRSGRPPDRC